MPSINDWLGARTQAQNGPILWKPSLGLQPYVVHRNSTGSVKTTKIKEYCYSLSLEYLIWFNIKETMTLPAYNTRRVRIPCIFI